MLHVFLIKCCFALVCLFLCWFWFALVCLFLWFCFVCFFVGLVWLCFWFVCFVGFGLVCFGLFAFFVGLVMFGVAVLFNGRFVVTHATEIGIQLALIWAKDGHFRTPFPPSVTPKPFKGNRVLKRGVSKGRNSPEKPLRIPPSKKPYQSDGFF